MINVFLDDWQMWMTLGFILVAVFLYSIDKFSLELVSIGILCVFLVFFHLFPVPDPDGYNRLTAEHLLKGFANPALFAIMGLLIIGQGMFQTGALEYPTRLLLRAYAKFRWLVIIAIFAFVMVVSAFLNNTPVVVMFIPIMSAIASQSGLAPSRIMIPLSFVSILGGMTTVIGSSTNLLASDTYRGLTGEKIDFFALAPMGSVLAAVGCIFIFSAGKFLLPSRHSSDVEDAYRPEGAGKQFIAQIELGRDHPLIGKGPVAGLVPDLKDVTIRMVQRREETFLPPFEGLSFRLHDTIIIAATRKSLTDLLKAKPDILAGMISDISLEAEEVTGELTMVEAIITPGSQFIGRSTKQIGFRYQTNCVILGIQRRSSMIRTQMSSMRLEAGDVLLLLGDSADLKALRADRDLVVLEYSMTQLPDARKASTAILIFAGVITATIVDITPIAISAFLGASLMVATGCLNIRQAARATDRRIFLLIGAAIAMGTAMAATGGAEFIGEKLVAVSVDGGPHMLIATLFIMTAILTNVLSNNATALLLTPVAYNAAILAELDPLVLVLTVIFGANCSFATPVAYQTNLLVMAPGHYRFKDFMAIGIPLIIILWIVYSLVAPFYFRSIGLL